MSTPPRDRRHADTRCPAGRRWSSAHTPSRTRERCWRCCRTRRAGWARVVGPPRRGPGRLGPRRGVRGLGTGPVRARRRRGGATSLAHAVVRDEVRQPGSGPVVFGSLPFADDSAEPGLLVVPEVVVGRRGDRWWVTTIGHDAHLPPIPSLRSVGAGRRSGRRPLHRRRAHAGRLEAGREQGGRADQPRRARQGGAGPRPARSRGRADRPALAARPAGRAVRPHLDVRRRWPGRGHSRAAGPPRPGPRPLAGARRHHPAHRRRRARPRAGGVTRPVQQGPRGARVCGSLGRRRRSPRTAPR